jgi:predicted ATP-dependent serine protease
MYNDVALSASSCENISTMNVVSTTTNKNFTRAADVQIPEIYSRRFKSGKKDLDEMFGGAGFMPNLTFTLAAAPGTGKTSMLLQVLELLEGTSKRTAYISGEENVEQLAFTSARLNVNRVPLANMTDIDEICDAIIENEFDFVVLDSLPALTSKKKMNKKQLEEYITTKIIKTAKENEVVIGTILHFTKSGTYKGSTLLPHSVDCNIIMTRNKEDYNLRDVDVTKNRFGSAGSSVFEITSRGFTFESVEEVKENNKPSKSSNKSDAVLTVLDTPKTMAQIVKETDISGAYLTTILRQLTNEGRIQKSGRGPEATYTIKS